MNKIATFSAAALLAGAALTAGAETKLVASSYEYKLGDRFEEIHLPSSSIAVAPLNGVAIGDPMVIQFNVRSTNKSPYNAVYLVPVNAGESLAVECDSVSADRFQEYLIDYLPYAPHQERHNNKTWSNGWRSFLAVAPAPEGDTALLVACARDEDGDIVGDLDDFFIKDVVVQYQTAN